MMNKTSYKNWQLTLDSENILWLLLDKENASTNTINAPILTELNEILDTISQQSEIKGLILGSAKSNGFIAGADIQQFTTFNTPDDALILIRQGQEICHKLEKLPIPTVAMIQGFCLGGGLELALACRYRVAEEGASTKLALPEILLGIHPGWGGSVRLPRLIGAIKGLDLILTGRSVNARTAKKLGLIDAAVPQRQLHLTAKNIILEKVKPHHATYIETLTNHQFVRPLLGILFRKKLKEKVRVNHYPGPYAVLDNWLMRGISEEAYTQEAISLSHLSQSVTAKNLIRLFFLRERLKTQGKGSDYTPYHVHIIGAGTMGGDIAAWCALKGLRVTLQDREPRYISPAIKRAYQLFKKKLKLPLLIQSTFDRLIPDTQGDNIKRADIIIEAIYENLEAKQNLFKELETIAKPTAILATNTSSIPLDEINCVLKQPERLVGIHFFNPVAQMPLVEIVKGKVTHSEVIQKAKTFVHLIDHLPIQVTSSPGFLVNRVLMPYLTEAMHMLEEGIPAVTIDEAALDFGMPMGPIELADTVGLDVCLSVAKNLHQYYGGELSQSLQKMVAEGQLGRKTQKGFYEYKKGKPIKLVPTADIIQDKNKIRQRLILRMLNEAIATLREGVIADHDSLDASMVFGTGFAPFRGGPMHYIKMEGKNFLYEELNNLHQQYGERFKPDAGWDNL
ncbi:MAG: Fatty acid oxidation complex subunit alpha [Legionellaceae bacterium]